jgi:hypothetical protein
MAQVEKQKLRENILSELLIKWPDQKPKIAELRDNAFTYELEENNNYTYYIVGYSINKSGELKVDWGSEELTMI